MATRHGDLRQHNKLKDPMTGSKSLSLNKFLNIMDQPFRCMMYQPSLQAWWISFVTFLILDPFLLVPSPALHPSRLHQLSRLISFNILANTKLMVFGTTKANGHPRIQASGQLRTNNGILKRLQPLATLMCPINSKGH